TAVVVFVGDRAYKAKKPVDMGFLDFSSASARQRACAREVELNRRFSPDVYEGVGDFRGPGCLTPEPVVVMRRMPDSRRLSHLVAVGAPVTQQVRQVARLLATCHARSSRSTDISRDGTRDALLARWESSFAQVREKGEGIAPMHSLEETEGRVRRYLAGREGLFDRRIRESRVVDGHGDLLAEDVFCLDDGPRLLDCLEFDDTLRHVDGLDDAAFLAMDLERLGAPDAAAYFLSCYSEYAGDPAPTSLWHHYVAYRAFVREKVAVIRAGQGAPEARSQAARLAGITVGHLRTSAVRMIMVGGLPGTGKSTLSAALADRLGLTLLSSDRVRKQLSGRPPDAPAGA
ncbi:AAA family ATPase, partial [[Kitasatospora] papulosa]|uniref:bifunctional aminoglycoside phosphotransferase/ATP-binding protein n=1 Tax=[Kitasatospora] papulosa TaxID=1464011 RepID=UPI0036B78A2C